MKSQQNFSSLSSPTRSRNTAATKAGLRGNLNPTATARMTNGETKLAEISSVGSSSHAAAAANTTTTTKNIDAQPGAFPATSSPTSDHRNALNEEISTVWLERNNAAENTNSRVIASGTSTDGATGGQPSGYLVEATLVPEEVNEEGYILPVHAEPMPTEMKTTSESSEMPIKAKQRRFRFVGLLVLVTIIASIVAGVTCASGSCGRRDSSTIIPDPNDISFQSSQFYAANWISILDPYRRFNGLDMDHPKAIQRYALAAFYYATGGTDSWTLCGQRAGVRKLS